MGGTGDWGLGTGDWGFGTASQSPVPVPQSPIPLWYNVRMAKRQPNRTHRNSQHNPQRGSKAGRVDPGPTLNEEGAIVKDWGGKLPIALSFPNTYYVGMSSLAFQILYSRFNAEVRRHPLPFSGGFRRWASMSRRDPTAGLSVSYDRYPWSLRRVVAHAAHLAPEQLGGQPADAVAQATVDTPRPEAPAPEGGPSDAVAA